MLPKAVPRPALLDLHEGRETGRHLFSSPSQTGLVGGARVGRPRL